MNQILSAKSKRRRYAIVIMAQILEITKEGTLKTQIMYKANLSFTQLNELCSVHGYEQFNSPKTFEGREVYVITIIRASIFFKCTVN